MTGGEWSSLSNYRSCCELAEAEVLLGFSHSRIFTRQTRVCAFDFSYRLLHVSVCTCAVCCFRGHCEEEVKPVLSNSLDLSAHWKLAVVCVREC